MSGGLAAGTRSRLRWSAGWLVALLVIMPPGPAASGQEEPAERKASAGLPFGVGEILRYQLHAQWFLISGRGTASLSVEAVDTVHTFPTYRLVSKMKGGISVFKVDDVQRSWLDVDQLFSRRFEQKLRQTTFNRDRTFDFLPDQMRYVQLGKPAVNGPLASAQPLDDVSFLYHLRTLALTVGREYREARYYKSDGNPVIARVLRTERIKVPAGEFEAIVVQPRIKSDGLFGEGGEALVWLSNDERRLPLRVRAKVKIATLTMNLESYTPSSTSNSR
ncbi:MAG: DUF3108 domain-containing protein [Longimicrobiales bacterium]